MSAEAPVYVRYYQRPDFSLRLTEAQELAQLLLAATERAQVVDGMQRWDTLRKSVDTQKNYAHVRYLMHMEEPGAVSEWSLWSQFSTLPQIEKLYAEALLGCPGRSHIAELFGEQCLRLAERQGAAYTDSKARLKEKEWLTRYDAIVFKRAWRAGGQLHSAPSVRALYDSPSRAVRREAWAVREQVATSHGEELDEIFDALIRIRTEHARAQGYADFWAYIQTSA